MNFTIGNLKILINDFNEKYELLNNLNYYYLIFILTSKNIKEYKNKEMIIIIILSKFSLGELKNLIDKFNKFKGYSALEKIDDEILDRILYSNNLPLYKNKNYKIACIGNNIPLSELKKILLEIEEKSNFLENLSDSQLVYILYANNKKEYGNRRSNIKNIFRLDLSLSQLKELINDYNNKFYLLKDLDEKFLMFILVSKKLPLYKNKNYKIACIANNIPLSELEKILLEIEEKSNFLENLSDSQLVYILYSNNKKEYKNRIINIKNIFRLDLSLSQLKELIDDYNNKFYLLRNFDEKFLMFILVSKNLEESMNINKMIGIITANFSFEELKSVIIKIKKIDFYSFTFLKELNEDILYAVLCINNISPYQNKNFNIAAICFNLNPDVINSTIEDIPLKKKLLIDLSVKSINHITKENNLPYVGSKIDKIDNICYHLSIENVENKINDEDIKKIEREMELEEQNWLRTGGIVGIDYSQREKFFR